MQIARRAGFKAALVFGGLFLADASWAQAQATNPLRVATLRWYHSAKNAVDVPTGASPTAVVFDGQAIWTANYFDNTVCHRAIPAFAVQCGDPTGSGGGGPGYSFADELPATGSYKVGSIAMANSGPDTNGSQFFIITGASGVALSADYTLFGQVTDGLDTTVKALDALGNPDQAANGVPPLEQIIIESVTITES